jgi:hypothetical protein
MKKLGFLALAVLLMPALAYAAGDPGLFFGFGEDARDVIAGETIIYALGPTNFGFQAGNPCPDPDTFCVHLTDHAGWFVSSDPVAVGECFDLDPGYYLEVELTFTIPCDVNIGDADTVIFRQVKCDDTLACRVDIPDCNPNTVYGGVPRYDADTVILTVVESPPALFILQDSLSFIAQGQTAAYVPFAICNGDPCAPPTQFDYAIQNTGVIPGSPDVWPQTGSTTALGGECNTIYAILNAGASNIGDQDPLTIIAWDNATGTVYDTCVQIVEVIAPVDVPLFTAPVVTILVLAMILAAAVIMRKRAVSKA